MASATVARVAGGGRLLATLAVAGALIATALPVTLAAAQTQEPVPQEPKPKVTPVTPAADEEPDDERSGTGVDGNAYTSPTFGYTLTWDDSIWTVENELLLDGYDGLQLGTEISIFYLEGYEGFAGDAEECLADAVNEIALRESVSDLESVTRPLPVEADEAGEAALFLYTLTFEDGGAVDIIEYTECRVLVPGEAVLEITFQTAEQAYDAELPAYRELLESLTLPDESTAATG
jgi:hypothetical protein